MTRYCYCLESNATDPCFKSCSIPGPTIWMNGHSTSTITIVNEVVGSTTPGPEGYTTTAPPTADPTEEPTMNPLSKTPPQPNKYKDMDITNFHTHGLHISPWVDNIFESTLPGGGWHAYPHVNDAIEGDNGGGHYPGTYWYHAHHHGAVAWQVSRGLYGTILMNPHDTFQGKEYNIGKYTQHLLMFDYQYFIPAEKCILNYDPTQPPTSKPTTCVPGYKNVGSNPKSPGITAYNASKSIAGGADDYSLCNVYCQFPADVRDKSHYRYDVETNISYDKTALGTQKNVETNLMRWFVNGQYQPIIKEVNSNEFRRLRFVNSMSNWFLQMQFPTQPDGTASSNDIEPSCSWYLIATDGVYFTNLTEADGGTIKECKKGTDGTWTGGGTAYMNYPLDCPTHSNNLLISPGGRADVLFKCTKTGTYTVIASDDDKGTGLKPWVFNNTQLFHIEVKDPTPTTMTTADLAPITTSPPTIPFDPARLPGKGEYPIPAHGSYLEDTLRAGAPTAETQCHCTRQPKGKTGGSSTVPGKSDCSLTFSNVNPFEINSLPFNMGPSMINIPTAIAFETFYRTFVQLRNHSLFLVEQEKLYQFNLDLLGHVYHQHINPFQMVQSVGGGRVALGGAWYDTIGSLNSLNIRTWTRDFGGIVITHCHLLQHEDQGMMGFYGIIPGWVKTRLAASNLFTCWNKPKPKPAIPTSNETGIMNAIADLKDLIEDIGVDVAEDLIKDIDEDTPSPVVASAVAPHGDTLTFSGWISEGLYFFKIPDHFSTISVVIVAFAIVVAVTAFQWYSRRRKQQKPYKRVAFEGVMPSDSESDVEAAAPMNL